MTAQNLLSVPDGFADPVIGSQRTFRAALEALAHPGKIVLLQSDIEPVSGLCQTAAALLLALLDSDCSLWVDPAIRATAAIGWLTFHTGCPVATDPGSARFAWISSLAELPAFSAFCFGTDRDPDTASTLLINVPALEAEARTGHECVGLRLQGPGIALERTIFLPDVDFSYVARFVALRAANHAKFPAGVDVFLTSPHAVVGLPRTTLVELTGGR